MIPLGVLASARVASGTWTPASVAGLAGWWDASDAATFSLSGSSVTQWGDKSGNARHMAPPATAPTRTGTRNGLPVVSFATGQRLRHVPAVKVGGSGFTIFAVAIKTGAANTYEAIPLTMTSGGSGTPLDGWDSDRIHGGSGNAGWTHMKTMTALAQLSMRADGSEYREWRDGTQVSTPIAFPLSTTGQVLTMASRDDGVTQLTGDIGEVILYDAALSTADRQTVEAYLKTKWGTP